MKQLHNTKPTYGFRKVKYVAGLASAVLAGASISTAKPQTVHADTNTNNNLSDHRATGEKAAEEELNHINDNPNSKTQSPTSHKRIVHIIDDSTQQDLKQEKPVKNDITKQNTSNVNKSVHDKDVETPKITDKDYLPDNPKAAPAKTVNHVDNTVDNTVDNSTVDNKTVQTADISTAALDLKKKQIATKAIKMVKLSNHFSLYTPNLTNANYQENDAYALNPKNNLHEHDNVNVNGGYDANTWGNLDVSKWHGSIQGNYYVLTSYDGNPNNIIVPNKADFENAGISTSGKQVGITRNLMHRLAQNATRIGLSKTNNEKIVARDYNWSFAFKGVKKTQMDLHNLDTHNITDMKAMFENASGLTTVGDLSDWDTSNVTNMSFMFNNASGLTNIGNLDNWNTGNVTDMKTMFNNASGLTNIGHLDNWNTSNVQYMGFMFDGASGLTNIGHLDNWNTSNVKDMKAMFQYASKLTNIGNLGNWNTGNVKDMSYMFNNASKLTNIGNLGNWNTGNVRYMSFMFNTASGLTTVGDLSDWDTRNVTDMSFMFSYASGLTNIGNLDNWNTGNVTNMKAMFQYASKLTNIGNLNNWNTGNVTDMKAMFLNASGLTNIGDLNNWNTGNVTDMSSMFSGASGLTNIGNLDSWDTGNVKDMRFMFYGVSGLTNIGNLNNWNTGNVKDMKAMFNNASKLTNIGNLSHWQTGNVTDMQAMFEYASKLTNIGNLGNWNTGNVTDMSFMFNNASGLTNIGNLNNWNTGNVTDMKAMFQYASKLTNIGNLDNWNTGKVTDMSFMFHNASGLTNIGHLDNWNTSNVTNMKTMFQDASKLTNIGNLDNWNTGKVTDMSFMFNNASSLTNIGHLDNWNTGNVQYMGFMFDNASKLTNIGDLSHWQTGNVQYMDDMFNNASGLTNIGHLDNWNTGNVTTMGNMFNGASKLTNIGNLDNWNTGNVKDMSYMFHNASGLTNIGHLDNWNTSNVTNMKTMFEYATSLTNIGNLDNWNTGKVTDMSWMFHNASSLTNIGNLSHWNTGNVKYMGFMFDNASKLTNIGDLSHWQTGNVQYMGFMFNNASGLTNIGNLDNWNTGNVQYMDHMFLNASKLTNIGHLDNWNTGNVKDMSGMFQNASGLTNIGNLDNWNTSNVQYMGFMFYNASGLTNIGNLSHWNTGNVQYMDHMFQNASKLTNIGDLSHWQTGNVKNMSWMFDGASGLTNIGNLGNWNTGNVTDMSIMFRNASGLTNIGDLSHWQTGNVTDMSAMFQNASKLTNIGDLSHWQTGNVKNMSWMFDGASGLTNIGNLDNWNTGNVKDMSYMFHNASGLTNIGHLDNWNTSNVTNMKTMFEYATSLTNIGNLDNWNTGKVTDMSWMFHNASSLTNIGNLSHWNTGNVQYMGAMFQDASKLTNIGDLSHWQTGNVKNMYAMVDMFGNDKNLGLIINNPNGWQHINDGWAFTGVPVVITNNANILKAKDDSSYTIDGQSISRSAIFDSSKSPIASQAMPTYKQNMTPQEQEAYAANVVKLYNQKLMQDYTKDHPDRRIDYAPGQDMNDPRKLVTASFVTKSNIAKINVYFVDDDNNEKVIGTDTVLGIPDKDLVVNPINDLHIPANYVPINFDKFNYGIVQDQNNKTITIHVKHKMDITNATKDNFKDYFSLNGSATYDKANGIVTLTPDDYFKVGNFYLKSKIDMNTSFTLTGQINLGNKTSAQGGADGVGFTLHTGDTNDIGHSGGDIGIGGLKNAIGFKLDPFNNGSYDGTQLPQFGNVITTNSNGEIINDTSSVQPLNPRDYDGQFHDFVVSYNGNNRKLTLKYTETGGNVLTWSTSIPESYQKMAMAVSAATGGGKNLQQFKISSFDFIPTTHVNDAYALNPKNNLHEHDNVNVNGGYDENTWGNLDVSKWHGSIQGNYYVLTSYDGNPNNIIVPNKADFENAGITTSGKQVGITRNLMHRLAQNATRIGLSKTNNKTIVASDSNWSNTFGGFANLTQMDLHNLDTTNVKYMGGMFLNASKLTTIGDLSDWNTDNVTNMSDMFNNASGLTNIGNLDNWNTGNVTYMNSMFNNASGLTNIGHLDNWNTSNVKDMGFMFSYASGLTNIGHLDNWNTSNVKDMQAMFQYASKLTNIGNLGNWNTGNVKDMSYMFNNASKLTNIGNLGNWNTGNVRYMSFMFNTASGLTTVGDLSDWDTRNVTDMSFMFSYASGLTNIGNLDNWNTGNVTNMKAMFQYASKLTNIGNLNNWNTGNVTDMKAMFYNASKLTNIGNLNNWNTGNVTDMSYMFSGASGLTNIGNLDNWNTGNVTYMNSMFEYASKLTNIGNLGNWNTGNVKDMSFMFNTASGLTNIGNLNNWNTGNVTDMKAMFQYASGLTNIGNLDNWNTGNVKDMSYMFNNASGLTNIGNLSHWNTGNVQYMGFMFNNASKLTNIGDLSHWNTGNVTNMYAMVDMFGNDKNLGLIINNPNGWQHINDGWAFTGVPVVITNNANILKAKDDSSYTIDGQSISRSAIFDSSKSPIASQAMPTYKQNMTPQEQEAYAANVVKLYNQKLMQDYTKDHPDRRIDYAPGQDMNDPRKLVTASFVTKSNIAKINVYFVDDDNNEKVIGTDTVLGIPDKDLVVNPINDLHIPANYVPINFDKFNYGIVQDQNNKTITIHVKHKIVGNAQDYHENAHNERDYLIDKIKSHQVKDLIDGLPDDLNKNLDQWSSNISIVHDPDQTYTANYNDEADINNKLNQINNDYTQQQNDIINQFKDWSNKVQRDNSINKLELHYHNDNLHLTKTSTYQVIEKMPHPIVDPNKYGNDQVILKTTITAGKDIARDMVTGETKQTKFLGKYTSGTVETGHTDGVDQTVIWGSDVELQGYELDPFYDETKEHFDVIHPQGNWTDHGAILSVSDSDNKIHFDYLVGQNYQSANDVEMSDFPDDRTWYVTMHPLQQHVNIVYVDDDNNENVIGNDTVLGITDKDLVVNPINDFHIPANYVPINFDKVDYGIVQGENNKTITIHVKHRIIGNAQDYQENANNERDYLLNKIKSHQIKNLIDNTNKDLDQWSSNISIVQDQDQTYTAKYNDEADINTKLSQINDDYIKQQNDIINQFKDWSNNNSAQKLELHYHNDNLHLTKTSTYQVIEKMPHPIIDPTKYGNDQVILKTTITAGKDIARDMATGETKQTKFLGKYTSGTVVNGHTDGVDQTVIWGSDVGLPGYELDPFYAETKEQFDGNWNDHGAVLSVSDSGNTIHFDYLVGRNYYDANGVEMSDFPDDQTWYVTMHPLAQHANIVYVDNDTNKPVKTTPLQGVTDEQINLTYDAPANYVIRQDQSLPNNYLFTASDNSDIDVWLNHDINHAAQPTRQAHTVNRIFKLQFNGQDIKHDYVQTGTITLTGDSDDAYNHAQWNEVTKDALTKLYQQYGYQTNGRDFTLDGQAFDTIDAVEIDPDTQDETHTINVVPTQRLINYIDIATNNTVASDSAQGVTNAVIKYVPNVPYGYELVTPQASYNIPISGDNTPFDIYIKSSMIHVDHTKPHHKGELIYDDTQPNMVYPNNVDDDDLNQTITRTINVYEPNGVITQIVQKVVLYRDADYDLSHHTTTYTPWQANGPRSWDSYTAPDFDGYTPDLSHISETTPLPDSQDVSIDIHYKETGSEVLLAYNDTDESGTEFARYNEGGDPNSTIHIDWLNHMTQDMPGYEIVPGQVINGQNLDDLLKNHETLTYTLSDVNKPIVINIRHIDSDVTNTDPKAKSSSERKLTIIEPNGHTTVYTQHVDFIRTATLDHATGLVSYSDWHVNGGYEADTNGGYKAIPANNQSTYTVDSLNIPAFANYETHSDIIDTKGNTLTDPNTDNILPSITVSPDSPVRNYLVTYHRKMNYDYFNDNNEQHVDGIHISDGSTNSQMSNSNKVADDFVKNAINKTIGNIINTDLSSVTKNSIKDVYHYVPHFSPTTVKIYTYVPHFAPTVIKVYQSIPTFGTKLSKANTLNPALLGFKPSNSPMQKPHNLATLGLMTTMLSILSK